MKPRARMIIAFSAVLIVLVLSVLCSGIDLAVSRLFYRPGQGFFLGGNPVFAFLHVTAFYGARILGALLLLGMLISLARRQIFLDMKTKAWTFLLLGLLLAPGLVANGIFKDHWGRARPSEIVEFGGTAHFSRALVPSHQCSRNCAFVSGDGAFGFYLPIFAYVVPLRSSRRTFWGGMAAACLFSLARLAAGAHFLSDTLFAGFFVQVALALLHAAMYGGKETKKYWQNWLVIQNKSKA